MYTSASSVGAGKEFSRFPVSAGHLIRCRFAPIHFNLRRLTMKFFKSAIFSMVAILAFGLATSANATCVSGCVDSVPNATTFSAGGGAQFSGFGGAVFTGQEGYALVEKVGSAGVNVKVDAAGKICGFDCQSGNFTYTGYANKAVKVSAGSLSHQSGLAATANNQGSAMGSVSLQVQKTLK